MCLKYMNIFVKIVIVHKLWLFVRTDLIDINAYTFKEENRAAEMFMSGVPTISDVMFMQWVDLVADEQGRLYKRVKSTNELFHSNRFYLLS